MGNNKISIKDIARLSGVSVSTISRILNNTGRYSSETEKKVREVIAETGYQPNLLAKGLRTSSMRSVGIIVPDITNEFFSSITLAIQNALFERSYVALICNTNEQPVIQSRQLEMLRASMVSGIIFISGEDVTDEDLADGIPKVFVDRIPWNADAKGIVAIESDSYEGGRIATEELLSAGCTRIAALFDSRGLTTQVARYSGYLRAHQDRGLAVARELYQPVTQVSFDSGYEATKALLRSDKSFDALFCYSDILASGAVRALTEEGIAIPGQARVVGYDNTSFSRFCTPPITTVAQPVEQMGAMAAELILKMCAGDQPQHKRYTLPVALVKRETT